MVFISNIFYCTQTCIYPGFDYWLLANNIDLTKSTFLPTAAEKKNPISQRMLLVNWLCAFRLVSFLSDHIVRFSPKWSVSNPVIQGQWCSHCCYNWVHPLTADHPLLFPFTFPSIRSYFRKLYLHIMCRSIAICTSSENLGLTSQHLNIFYKTFIAVLPNASL